MPNIGLPEIIILLVLLLLIFGPKRLPGLGRSLGHSMREFKDSVSGKNKDKEDEDSLPPAISASVAKDPITGDKIKNPVTGEPVDAEVVPESKRDA